MPGLWRQRRDSGSFPSPGEELRHAREERHECGRGGDVPCDPDKVEVRTDYLELYTGKKENK